MPKYAAGKHALAISDRSGLQFPWREMVTEWTGAFVHTSEYEPKQPQLRPKTLSADSMSLRKVRPARTAFPTPTILPNNPFTTTVSTTVTVTQPNHNFSSGDAVRFRQIKQENVGGVTKVNRRQDLLRKQFFHRVKSLNILLMIQGQEFFLV
jgi:hypothetical protein